jgi:hypothetical protein
MVDLGMAGPDKGKGGNFLVLPLGYDGEALCKDQASDARMCLLRAVGA